MKPVLYVINRQRATVEIVNWATCYDHLRSCFWVGIQMSDGAMANGIGRMNSRRAFFAMVKRAGGKLLNG